MTDTWRISHSIHAIAFSVAIASASVFVCGCQTARPKEFNSVHVGMSKDEVLDAAGNPTVTRRWKGKDRWIYTYPSVDTKEVHFVDGKAVYVGVAYQPPVSAEDQDQRNDETNTAEALRLKTLEHQAAEERDQKFDPIPTREDESKKLAPNWIPVN
jgi:outer membrane protein assembly factor BamE (lipoprotein component of BamABCDE complex)